MHPTASIAATERFRRLLGDTEYGSHFLGQKRVLEAFELAVKRYGDIRHWSGMTNIEHVLHVLEVLLAFEPDEDAVIACLLQHVLGAKVCTLGELEEKFGRDVRVIVSGVHLLAHVTTRNKRMTLESLRLMFLRVSDDVRVVLIVLCKQRAMLDHLDILDADIRKRFCRDVLLLFAPVAARLGIYTLKHQLEDKAFPVVYATDAARIQEQLSNIHQQNGRFLETTAKSLRTFLRTEGVSAEVETREKHPYSIFRKMRQKSVTHVEELYDLFALRVVVDNEIACYQVLGLLHRIGHPVAHRFKDYIAFPKPNGYQSLHTTLAHLPGAPDWVFVEVQVRTRPMHREAEFGIAAHWSYKEGGADHDVLRRAQFQRALTHQQPETTGESALMDHIFVLTPRGDVIELPEGATPLDFAFQLHTDLGISFKAAKVNGGIVAMTYQLENGDIVEIVKQREPKPSPKWLTLLRTANARSRLKRFLAAQEQPEKEEAVIPKAAPKPKAKKAIAKAVPIVISEIPMPLRFAKCCKPKPLDRSPIVGVVNRGKINVHLKTCKMIRGSNPERQVRVRWS